MNIYYVTINSRKRPQRVIIALQNFVAAGAATNFSCEELPPRISFIHFVLNLQELEEPGPEESSRFDMLCPTVVRPKLSSLTTSSQFMSGEKVVQFIRYCLISLF